MTISSVSAAAANLHPAATANKAPVTQAQPAAKTAPPAIKPAADTDGDRDGSGGINVKA
jgi:hypothetical protein